MNLELLDPFALQDFPDAIEDCLEDGFIVKTRCNHRGSLVAAACSDGRCLIIDFDTVSLPSDWCTDYVQRAVAATLFGHIGLVTSLSCVSI